VESDKWSQQWLRIYSARFQSIKVNNRVYISRSDNYIMTNKVDTLFCLSEGAITEGRLFFPGDSYQEWWPEIRGGSQGKLLAIFHCFLWCGK